MAALAPRWHLGHALLAGLGLLCALLLVRLILAERPALPTMPAVAPPVLADPALLARQDLFFAGSAAAGDSLPVTDLPFSLHGVRHDGATGRGGAIIAGPDGAQQSFGVGDDLGDGVLLAAIAVDHVVLERNGQREALWLDQSSEAVPLRHEPHQAPDMAMAVRAVTVPPASDAADEAEEIGGAAEMAAAPPDPMLGE